MKMGGIMIAHSLLQRGPGLPCLAPYVYEFILWGEKEQAAAYVTFEDLPETPQTEVLMAFLTGVSNYFYFLSSYAIHWHVVIITYFSLGKEMH